MRIKKLLGNEFIPPAKTGTYLFQKEAITWSCKNVDEILHFFISQYVIQHCDIITQIEKVDVTINIDHGKCFSCTTFDVIICWVEGSGKWCQHEKSFLLANAQCWKDNRK